MYAFFEVNDQETIDKGDDKIIKTHTSIQSLSWMNKTNSFSNSFINSTSGSTSAQVNNTSQDSDGLSEYAKANDAKFKKYLNQQEGWLATGNSNSMVGCTFTTCLSEQQYEYLRAKEKNILPNKLTSETSDKDSEIVQPLIDASTATNEQTVQNTQSTVSANATTSISPNSNSSNLSNLNNLNRTNFNLRGHKSDIKLVRWNEPYQKLASCDSKGLIYVWVKYEGRWSIELINDRGNCVSDFAWSHDGRMAVICYQDGFVLVGSVNGQRFWSHLYDLPQATITSATWTPNDAYVLLGLSNGNLMVVDEHGTVITRHNLKNDCILSLAYNTPKFFIHEQVEDSSSLQNFRFRMTASANNSTNQSFNILNNNPSNSHNSSSNILLGNVANNDNKIQVSKNNKIDNNNFILACLFKANGLIYLLRSYDDLDPIIIETKLEGIKFEWSSCGKILAVGGYQVEENTSISEFKQQNSKQTKSNNKQNNLLEDTQPKCFKNFIKFYNNQGNLMYQVLVPTIKNEIALNNNSIVSQLEQLHHQKKQPQTPVLNQLFSALTWGHNDQRLFIACNSTLHILRVHKEIPTLSLLAQMCIKTRCKELKEVEKLTIPSRFEEKIKYCYQSTIKSVYPKLSKLRNFVCNSLPNNERLHCTLKRMKIGKKQDYYILYLEYLGGLIPLLTAKKSSKFKPDFIIFDPFLGVNKTDISKKNSIRSKKSDQKSKSKFKQNLKNQSDKGLLHKTQSSLSLQTIQNESSGYSSEEISMKILDKSENNNIFSGLDQMDNSIVKIDELKSNSGSRLSINSLKNTELDRSGAKPLKTRLSKQLVKMNKNKKTRGKKIKPVVKKINRKYLVAITSNIWGTKFKFSGQNYLPNNIGQITYKTSLFHLQPRQMKIVLDDLSHSKPSEAIQTVQSEIKPELTSCDEKAAPTEFQVLTQTLESPNLIPQLKSSQSTLSLTSAAGTINKKHLDNFISIKTSATLGALPDLTKAHSNNILLNKSSSHNDFDNGSLYNYSLNNCNDEIASIHGLIENKFSNTGTGDFFEKFNLPVLKLAKDNLEIENYIDNNLITSQTDFYEDNSSIQLNESNEEIQLLATSTRSLANQNNPIPATTTTTSLTTTIYPKYHLKSSKFNLLNKLNRNGEFLFSSNKFFNFLLNRKIPEKSEYQKLEDKIDFNSVNVRTKPKNKEIVEKIETVEEADESGQLDTDKSSVEQVSFKKSTPLKNQFTLKNKPPIWNETNQVYQLDFGGRVTQESAKNFQIEFNGKQVMQFGRIDANAYTLDFEWPFTAVQAFSIALANITQRFK